MSRPGFPRHAACAIALFVATACGGTTSTPTSPPPPPPATPVTTTTVTYQGLFGSGTFTGAVTLNAIIPTAVLASTESRTLAITSATGTAKFSGASTSTVSLTGTFDTTTNRFTLTGSGWNVDVTATDGIASGTITTPVGTGSVGALVSTETAPVAQYCGTYRGTESGKFLVVVKNGLATGVAAQDGLPGGVTVTGSTNGNTVSLSWSWTEGSGGRGLATGTISGTGIGGTWSNTDNQSGTWSGTPC